MPPAKPVLRGRLDGKRYIPRNRSIQADFYAGFELTCRFANVQQEIRERATNAEQGARRGGGRRARTPGVLHLRPSRAPSLESLQTWCFLFTLWLRQWLEH